MEKVKQKFSRLRDLYICWKVGHRVYKEYSDYCLQCGKILTPQNNLTK